MPISTKKNFLNISSPNRCPRNSPIKSWLLPVFPEISTNLSRYLVRHSHSHRSPFERPKKNIFKKKSPTTLSHSHANKYLRNKNLTVRLTVDELHNLLWEKYCSLDYQTLVKTKEIFVVKVTGKNNQTNHNLRISQHVLSSSLFSSL